ncbi:hypothetical protein SAL_0613 [Streptococcus agalactiae 515]|nr:hypothetical protein SAL_0613 [Streptococcus agalactiae 515]
MNSIGTMILFLKSVVVANILVLSLFGLFIVK